MSTVITLLGKKGSGKSTIAKHLRALYGAQVFSFAKPLKDMAHEQLSRIHGLRVGCAVPGEEGVRVALYERSHLDDYPWKTGELLVGYGDFPGSGIVISTIRSWLQTLGTECGRKHLGEDVWVNACLLSITKEAPALAVIEDGRFTNEARGVYGGGGIVVKLVCLDDASNDTHESEAGVDLVPPEFVHTTVVAPRGPKDDRGNFDTTRLTEAFDVQLGKLAALRSDLRQALNAARV